MLKSFNPIFTHQMYFTPGELDNYSFRFYAGGGGVHPNEQNAL